MSEVVYLGHIIGGGVIKPEIEKVGAVARFPRPTQPRLKCVLSWD